MCLHNNVVIINPKKQDDILAGLDVANAVYQMADGGDSLL
jgi:hypothetical protein